MVRHHADLTCASLRGNQQVRLWSSLQGLRWLPWAFFFVDRVGEPGVVSLPVAVSGVRQSRLTRSRQKSNIGWRWCPGQMGRTAPA